MCRKASKLGTIEVNINHDQGGLRHVYCITFASCKKQRGRSKYLLSVPVKVGQDKNGDNGIDARIVCVRNRNKHKDWIAIICTDMSLSEQDIIRIYGHRWDIYGIRSSRYNLS